MKRIFIVVEVRRLRCSDYVTTYLLHAFYEGYTQFSEEPSLSVNEFQGVVIHIEINYRGEWLNSKLAFQSGLISNHLYNEEVPSGYAIREDSDRSFVADSKYMNEKIL